MAPGPRPPAFGLVPFVFRFTGGTGHGESLRAASLGHAAGSPCRGQAEA